MSRQSKQHILQVIMIAVLASAVTWLITYTSTIKGAEKDLEGMVADAEQYSKLNEIQSYVDNYFVGEYDRDEVMDSAAAGYVEGLGDRWTYYMSAEQYETFKTSNEDHFVGIGVTITWNEEKGCLQVMDVNEGSPAEEAGLAVMDYIIKVDGVPTSELGYDATVAAVRGEEGSSVTLIIERGDGTLEKTVERRTIVKNYVKSTMLDGKVGYIRITEFAQGAQDEFLAAVESLLSEGAEGFVLDVRNNPGGDLQVLLSILNRILADKDLFTEEYQDGERYTFTSDETGLDVPISVLTNANTYSAAEYLAAVLQEYGVCNVVGEATTGKGYGQTTFELKDGSAIVLSIIRYYTPQGRSLKETGVTPDREVELDEKLLGSIGTMTEEEDPQLAAAAALVRPAA